MVRNISWSLINNLFKNNPKVGFSGYIKKYRSSPNIYNYYKSSTLAEQSSNRLSAPVHYDVDYHDVKSFKQFIDESSMESEQAIDSLRRDFQIPRDIAKEAVKDFEIFRTLSKATITKNYNLLVAAGVDKELLKLHPYAFASTTEDLEKKITSFETMKLDINQALLLFKFPAKKLVRLAALTESDKTIIPQEFNNRIEYLANRFECSIRELCRNLVMNKYFLTLSMKKIYDITENLREAGTKGRMIRTNLFLYGYKVSRVLERIDKARTFGNRHVKPWAVRCPANVFARMEEDARTRIEYLKPYASLEEYIMALFDCDKNFVDCLFRKDPSLYMRNIKALTGVLLFMREKGYKFENVYLGTRALHCREESLRYKYDRWVKHDLGQPSLSLISASNSAFENLFQKKLQKRFNLNDREDSYP
ncbi:transcription termination factor, mitochondrial [Microplitis mediator]|uniref:transcription termination factor, mitochondrial n=1 Tax=Microplitis mediator TaxID=375433 RepID=UPI0025546E16|nr:transcription termination factor, mitochondrial [Microplitis mediator]